MEIKSILNQTNTLKEVGDNIIIKTPLPIKPTEILVIGYDVITTDIIDLVDWIAGFYYISPISENLQSINNIKWTLLEKDQNGINEEFQSKCKEQQEPYYIYFKFEKFQSNGQPITITKVNLKIKDYSNTPEGEDSDNSNSTFYSRSIFSQIPLNSKETESWSYNVLDKVKENGILPSYIDRNKDFSVFWGWITHFFAVIVSFGRSFKNIFTISEDNLYYIGEFLKQRGYLKDSRINILEKININNSKEIIYFPIVNKNDNKNTEIINTGFLGIGKASRIHIKLGGYSESLGEFEKFCVEKTTIKIGYYLNNLQNLRVNFIDLNKKQMKDGITLRVNPFDNIKYISISYPNNLGQKNIFYFRVFIDSIGEYNTENNVENLFNIQKSFKNRGGIKSENLIKQILETKNEDGFYSNYIPNQNVGWFLNKNCPFTNQLVKPLELDSFIPESIEGFQNGVLVKFSEKLIFLNQYTSIKTNQQNLQNIKEVYYFSSFVSDKGNSYSQNDVVFGNWEKDNEKNNKVFKSNINRGLFQNNVDFNNLNVELPIILTQDKRYSVFSTDNYNLRNKDFYIVTKNIIKGNDKLEILESLKYIKLNYLYISTVKSEKNSIILDTQVKKGANYTLSFIKENNVLYYNFTSSLGENLKGEFYFTQEEKIIGFKILNISKNIKFLLKYSNEEDLILNSSLNSLLVTTSDTIPVSLVDLKVNLFLRKLPMQLGFLNIQKYILCYYTNNGIFSEEETKDIIDSKILPYNGFRIFINNSNFKDELFKKLELKSFDANKYSENLGHLVVKFEGGIAPYFYTLTKIKDDKSSVLINNKQIFDNNINLQNLVYSKYNIVIVDSLGDKINENFNLNAYNKIDYKIKIGIDIDGNLEIQLYIWGGNESLYNVSYINASRLNKTQYISAKIWTKLEPMSIDALVSKQNINITIIDSDVTWLNKTINLVSLLKNSAIEAYDNNEGSCYLN